MALKDYELIEVLGQGGFATVHAGRHKVLRRIDAIKKLDRIPRLAKNAQVRFERECVAMARVEHPNVTRIHDAGVSKSGIPWLAMELMEMSMADLGPLSWQGALDALQQAAAGVQALHDAGIVHGDLKAQNLLLGRDDRVRVSDLGLATISQALPTELMTSRNTFTGTVPFMAPELFDGADPSPAIDVYALGATLHQLISGDAPFVDSDSSFVSLIRCICDEPPPSLPAPVPSPVSELVGACMAKDPEDRPSSAREVMDLANSLLQSAAPMEPAVESLQLFDAPTAAPDLAERRLRTRAAGGDLRAMAALAGRLRVAGRGDEAELWLRRAAATGDPDAMYHLGMHNRAHGRDGEAAEWMQRAADAGHLLAHAEL